MPNYRAAEYRGFAQTIGPDVGGESAAISLLNTYSNDLYLLSVFQEGFEPDIGDTGLFKEKIQEDLDIFPELRGFTCGKVRMAWILERGMHGEVTMLLEPEEEKEAEDDDGELYVKNEGYRCDCARLVLYPSETATPLTGYRHGEAEVPSVHETQLRPGVSWGYSEERHTYFIKSGRLGGWVDYVAKVKAGKNNPEYSMTSLSRAAGAVLYLDSLWDFRCFVLDIEGLSLPRKRQELKKFLNETMVGMLSNHISRCEDESRVVIERLEKELGEVSPARKTWMR